MLRIGGVRRVTGVAAFAAVALLTAAGGRAAGARAAAAGGCNAATGAAVAGVDASVMARIYRNELNGSEVRADSAHVTGAADLLGALARGDTAGVRAATHRLVYHRHWHIVRLRVLDRPRRVFADVGPQRLVAEIECLVAEA